MAKHALHNWKLGCEIRGRDFGITHCKFAFMLDSSMHTILEQIFSESKKCALKSSKCIRFRSRNKHGGLDGKAKVKDQK